MLDIKKEEIPLYSPIINIDSELRYMDRVISKAIKPIIDELYHANSKYSVYGDMSGSEIAINVFEHDGFIIIDNNKYNPNFVFDNITKFLDVINYFDNNNMKCIESLLSRKDNKYYFIPTKRYHLTWITDTILGRYSIFWIYDNGRIDYSNNCTRLTTIFIPENVTTIGESAFENCYGLRTVTVHDHINILPSAFEGCVNLDITVRDDLFKRFGDEIFHSMIYNEFLQKFVNTIGSVEDECILKFLEDSFKQR